MSEHFFIYNGKLYPEGTPVIGTQNRALMYGDGLFETMFVQQGFIINGPLHFERFFQGLELLKFSLSEQFSTIYYKEKIRLLLQQNNIDGYARVRLMAFRDSMNLQNRMSYILEAWPMKDRPQYDIAGLKTALFRDVTKSCDRFSNLKSNNYLPGVMAIISASERSLDECILLNSNGRVCESAIANVFIVKSGIIYTPPLSEGCVAGIVRRWIVENSPPENFRVIQKELTIEELFSADELFLTNSIKPVRSVALFEGKKLEKEMTDKIAKFVFDKMLKTGKS